MLFQNRLLQLTVIELAAYPKRLKKLQIVPLKFEKEEANQSSQVKCVVFLLLSHRRVDWPLITENKYQFTNNHKNNELK